MIEHRLIERMIKLIDEETHHITARKQADPLFIDQAVDFVRTYADRTHHGKEEDIMFRDLAGKELSADDQRAMRELVQEHKYGRQTVRDLLRAKEEYVKGNPGSLDTIVDKLRALVKFYPEHIRKEDKGFFPATERYFSVAEQEAILREFEEFDRRMIHEKYQSVVERLEAESAP